MQKHLSAIVVALGFASSVAPAHQVWLEQPAEGGAMRPIDRPPGGVEPIPAGPAAAPDK
ncbi:hypothetical protein [Pseudothauera rhizosphaerae]|uniref:hypothetical protein n=1 Tax=Pseudothauera rhizosphaerae TaxID=2565932 RepID=UPI001454B863|nr:hypothetical protein [Pseudothauera rhizosphaerae]